MNSFTHTYTYLHPHTHTRTHTLTHTQNMVGPGEVDEDLQPEVTEECSKYGDVANCLVYEVRHCSVCIATTVFASIKLM